MDEYPLNRSEPDTSVNAGRPGRIYFSECLVRDHGRAKVRDGDFSRRWIAHGWPTRRRGPAKSHFRDCPTGYKGGKRAETKRLGLQSKPAERRRSSVTPGLGPVYTRPKRGPFSGVSPHIQIGR